MTQQRPPQTPFGKRYATSPLTGGYTPTASSTPVVPGSVAEKTQRQSWASNHRVLLSALNQFTKGLAIGVRNPLQDKFGDAYRYLVAGDTYRFRDKTDEAIVQYHQALDIDPLCAEAHMGLGKCYRRVGQLPQAIMHLKQALTANAFNKDIHLELAKCYVERQAHEKSRQHYEKAIRIDPAFIDARFGLAMLTELTSGSPEQAIPLYQAVLEQDDGFLPAYNNLGSLYLRLGYFDEAQASFESLIERVPQFGRAYLGLALTLDRKQDAVGALKAYRQALQLSHKSKHLEQIQRRIAELSVMLGVGKATDAQGDTVIYRVK